MFRDPPPPLHHAIRLRYQLWQCFETHLLLSTTPSVCAISGGNVSRPISSPPLRHPSALSAVAMFRDPPPPLHHAIRLRYQLWQCFETHLLLSTTPSVCAINGGNVSRPISSPPLRHPSALSAVAMFRDPHPPLHHAICLRYQLWQCFETHLLPSTTPSVCAISCGNVSRPTSSSPPRHLSALSAVAMFRDPSLPLHHAIRLRYQLWQCFETHLLISTAPSVCAISCGNVSRPTSSSPPRHPSALSAVAMFRDQPPPLHHAICLRYQLWQCFETHLLPSTTPSVCAISCGNVSRPTSSSPPRHPSALSAVHGHFKLFTNAMLYIFDYCY